MSLPFTKSHISKPASLFATTVVAATIVGCIDPNTLNTMRYNTYSASNVSAAPDSNEYMGEWAESYAMVSRVEPIAEVYKEGFWEELYVDTPVTEGDVIRCDGQVDLQLGDGSRIALGKLSEMEIESLFGSVDDYTESRFSVDYGRIRVVGGLESDAIITINAPVSNVELESGSDALIEIGNDRSMKVKVNSGNVVVYNNVDAVNIKAGEQLTVYGDNERFNRPAKAVSGSDTLNAFEVRTSHLVSYNQSQSRSYNYLPPQIRYYGDSLDRHGDWVQVAGVGWCWRPQTVSADWRPYWRGHWNAEKSGMTWVSYDPFGYVTHHYGRWGWDVVNGWYWIPGIYYSPAWVAWDISDTFFAWAPLGYHDRPVYWGHSSYRHECWHVIDIKNVRSRNLHKHTIWNSETAGRFPANQPNRSLAPAWRQGPLIVTRQEFARPEPLRFRAALTPSLSRQRLKAYEDRAGSTKAVRLNVSANTLNGSRNDPNRPFEDQTSRSLAAGRRSVLRNDGSGVNRKPEDSAPPSMNRAEASRIRPGSRSLTRAEEPPQKPASNQLTKTEEPIQKPVPRPLTRVEEAAQKAISQTLVKTEESTQNTQNLTSQPPPKTEEPPQRPISNPPSKPEEPKAISQRPVSRPQTKAEEPTQGLQKPESRPPSRTEESLQKPESRQLPKPEEPKPISQRPVSRPQTKAEEPAQSTEKPESRPPSKVEESAQISQRPVSRPQTRTEEPAQSTEKPESRPPSKVEESKQGSQRPVSRPQTKREEPAKNAEKPESRTKAKTEESQDDKSDKKESVKADKDKDKKKNDEVV